MGKLNWKILTFLLSILILVLLVLYANPAKFLGLISRSNYSFLLIAFCISTVNVLLRVLKWKILLDNISFSKVLPVQLVGITISNFTPGKIAEPFKAVILKLREGRSVSSVLPSVIWERILDIIVLVILAIFGAYSFLMLDSRFFLISAAVILVFLALLAAALLVLYKRTFGRWVFRALKRLPLVNRVSENFIQTFQESNVKKSRIFCSFIITATAWVLEGFILYYAFLSIGIELPPLMLASIFALATLIGVASALPGGIGSTDVVMAIFLSYFGIETSLAVAGVLLARFLAIWYVNLLGGLSLVYLMKKLKISYKSILG